MRFTPTLRSSFHLPLSQTTRSDLCVRGQEEQPARGAPCGGSRGAREEAQGGGIACGGRAAGCRGGDRGCGGEQAEKGLTRGFGDG